MSDIKQLDELKPKIPIKINSLVGAFNYLFSPTYEFNGERHVYWEVVGVFDSCARIISDSTELFLHTNEFYIHRPMEFHAIYPHKQSLHVGIFAFTSNSEDLYSIADKVILAPDLMNLYSSILLEGSQALAGINSVPPLDSTNSPPFAADQTTKILAEFFLINLIRAFSPPPQNRRENHSQYPARNNRIATHHRLSASARVRQHLPARPIVSFRVQQRIPLPHVQKRNGQINHRLLCLYQNRKSKTVARKQKIYGLRRLQKT